VSAHPIRDRVLHPFRGRPQRGWVPGNAIELLENGEQYYPAVFEAISQARVEVVIETFILFEDKVGLQLKDVLVAAARRGVSVDVMVDGFGSPDFSDEYLQDLADAGVRLRAFDQQKRLFGSIRTNMFRRMHRKIVVVDGQVAFVGGINFSADHLGDFGPEAKQDYSVRLRGPVVERIRAYVREQIRPALPPAPAPKLPAPAPAGDADVMFVWRDNRHHRDDIERQYRAAIRSARKEVTIANAYFFPGYRLLKTIRQAARRGVRVRLILQGQPDMAIVKTAAGLLYDHLQRAGVRIFEYCERPLHGKVAVVDDLWATVGSSNLDPLSLSMNLEANVVIRDRDFAAVLRARLDHLIEHNCREVCEQRLPTPRWWEIARSAVVVHVLRRFPAWAGLLPAHRPVLHRPPGTGGAPPVSDQPGVESVTEPSDS
jgi:cardiolipin synthase